MNRALREYLVRQRALGEYLVRQTQSLHLEPVPGAFLQDLHADDWVLLFVPREDRAADAALSTVFRWPGIEVLFLLDIEDDADDADKGLVGFAVHGTDAFRERFEGSFTSDVPGAFRRERVGFVHVPELHRDRVAAWVVERLPLPLTALASTEVFTDGGRSGVADKC